MPIPELVCRLAGWTVCGLFTGLAAIPIWLRLRTGARHLDAPLAVAVWMAIITALILIAGCLRILDAAALSGISGLGGVALALRFREDYDRCAAEWRGILEDVRQRAARRRWLTAGLGLLALLLFLRAFLHAWFLPPYVYDTLAYHLPRLAEWVQHRGLVYIETSIDRFYWPANFEAFQCWFVVFLHHDGVVELAGLFPYLLAVLSVYSLGRTLGATAAWSAAAAGLFATTPAIVMGAVSCKNDIAAAAWFLFLTASLLHVMRQRHSRSTALRSLVILGLAFGVAFGTKPYIAFLLPGLALLGVGAFFLRASSAKEAPAILEHERVWLVSILMLGVFLGLFWYVRNAFIFGNPFYPSDFKIMGHVISGTGNGPDYAHSEFDPASIKVSLKLMKNKLFDPTGPLTPELPGQAGWGWFIIACGLPSLGYLLFSSAALRWLTASFLLALCCLFGFVQPDVWNLRYALWFPALLAVAFALMGTALRLRATRSTLALLAAASGLLNIALTLNNGYMNANAWRLQYRTPFWERSAAQQTGDCYAELLARVPRGETIGYCMHPNAWLYPIYGPDYAWRAHHIDMFNLPNVPALMRSGGTRYLFIPARGKQVKAKLAPAVTAGDLEYLGENLYILKK